MKHLEADEQKKVIQWARIAAKNVVTAYFWQQNNKDAFYDKAVSVKSVRMVA